MGLTKINRSQALVTDFVFLTPTAQQTGNINISGNITATNINATGGLSVTGTLNAKGDTIIGDLSTDTLEVSASSNFRAPVVFYNDVTLSGTGSDFIIGGDLTVNGSIVNLIRGEEFIATGSTGGESFNLTFDFDAGQTSVYKNGLRQSFTIGPSTAYDYYDNPPSAGIIFNGPTIAGDIVIVDYFKSTS